MIFFFLLSIGQAGLAQNKCTEVVNGIPYIKNDTYQKMNTIMAEALCMMDIEQCKEVKQILNTPPPEERIAAVETELAMIEASANTDSDLTTGAIEGIKKTQRFASDTTLRATTSVASFAADAAMEVAENSIDHVRESITEKIANRVRLKNNMFKSFRSKAILISQRRILFSKIKAMAGKGLGITTGISSTKALIATLLSYIAIEYLRPEGKVAYVGSCNNANSLASKIDIMKSTYLLKEQAFTKKGKKIGECYNSVSYHNGLHNFFNDVGYSRQAEILSDDDALCKNIHDLQKRFNDRPQSRIESCSKNNIRLTLKHPTYNKFLGNKVTLVGDFSNPQQPKIKNIALLAQTSPGKKLQGPILGSAISIDPHKQSACLQRHTGTCKQLWTYKSKKLAWFFGPNKTKNQIEKECLEKSRNSKCYEGYDVVSLKTKLKSGAANPAELYMLTQFDLSQSLNYIYNEAATCCAAYGSKAVSKTVPCVMEKTPRPKNVEGINL